MVKPLFALLLLISAVLVGFTFNTADDCTVTEVVSETGVAESQEDCTAGGLTGSGQEDAAQHNGIVGPDGPNATTGTNGPHGTNGTGPSRTSVDCEVTGEVIAVTPRAMARITATCDATASFVVWEVLENLESLGVPQVVSIMALAASNPTEALRIATIMSAASQRIQDTAVVNLSAGETKTVTLSYDDLCMAHQVDIMHQGAILDAGIVGPTGDNCVAEEDNPGEGGGSRVDMVDVVSPTSTPIPAATARVTQTPTPTPITGGDTTPTSTPIPEVAGVIGTQPVQQPEVGGAIVTAPEQPALQPGPAEQEKPLEQPELEFSPARQETAPLQQQPAPERQEVGGVVQKAPSQLPFTGDPISGGGAAAAGAAGGLLSTLGWYLRRRV